MRCNNGRIDTKNFCVSQGRFFLHFHSQSVVSQAIVHVSFIIDR